MLGGVAKSTVDGVDQFFCVGAHLILEWTYVLFLSSIKPFPPHPSIFLFDVFSAFG